MRQEDEMINREHTFAFCVHVWYSIKKEHAERWSIKRQQVQSVAGTSMPMENVL